MVQQRFGVHSSDEGWLRCSFLPALEKARSCGDLSRHDYYELRRGVLNDFDEEEV